MKKLISLFLFLPLFSNAQYLGQVGVTPNSGKQFQALAPGTTGQVLTQIDGTHIGFANGGGGGGSSWLLTGNTGLNGYNNWLGYNDTALGLQFHVGGKRSGWEDTIGSTYFGYKAGYADVPLLQNFNTGIGIKSLSKNTTGSINTSVGAFSLIVNTSGSYNTSIGNNSLGNNTTGSSNTAIGVVSLSDNNGNYNTCVGYASLVNATSCSRDIAVGYDAGISEISGNKNIFIGDSAGYNSTNSINTMTFGYKAKTWNNNTISFDDANDTAIYLPNATFKKDSAGVISYPTAGQTIVFEGNNKGFKFATPSGGGGLNLNDTIGGSGYIAGSSQVGTNFSSWIVGGNHYIANPASPMILGYTFQSDIDIPLNIIVDGYVSGIIDPGGTNNTFLGVLSGVGINSGGNNTVVGAEAVGQYGFQSTGSDNCIFGASANNQGGGNNESYNTIIGYSAGIMQQGKSNVIIGSFSTATSVSGYDNVTVGDSSLFLTQSNNNTSIGERSGQFNTTGSGNLFIGSHAGDLAPPTLSHAAWVDPTLTTIIGGSALYITPAGQIRDTTFSRVTASNDLTAQSAAVSSITTLTTGSSISTYRVGGYINVTAISVDVIQVQITYTDENNTSQTEIFATNGLASSVSTTGNNPLLSMDIRCKNATTITIKTVLTTGAGSITYDVGGNITKLY